MLAGFLKRAAIYATASFSERYETQARKNLAWAIDQLSHANTASDLNSRWERGRHSDTLN